MAVPPPMPKRTIAPPTEPLPGSSTEIRDGEYSFTLFIPTKWKAEGARNVELTVHFHGAAWFAITEHLRRGLTCPLLVASLGEGSSVYRKPFEDHDRFARLLLLVEEELRKRGAPSKCRIDAVGISSFSAGYGAVRELVKVARYVQLIHRIVLADSLYASFGTATDGRPTLHPAPEHIEPWLAFCRLAARGSKTFVLTFSHVPTPAYASSSQCAAALAEIVGAKLERVPTGAVEATNDPLFPLLTRADRGRFHLWGYGGSDAQAHMTHARHIADVWLALDAAEKARARAGSTRPDNDLRWD
jgi:hypothetical protein